MESRSGELTRQDTKMLQAVSVMAMLCLHLFDTMDYSNKFIPLIFFGGVPLSFYVAQLCDFCVFGFAFCSGYGHMAQNENTNAFQKRKKGLLSVLVTYWTVLVLFTAVSVILKQGDRMPGTPWMFVMNALTLDNSFNGAWWYMFAYLVIVLSSPVLLKAAQRFNSLVVVGFGFAVYLSAFYVRFKMGTDNWWLLKYGQVGMTLFEYLIGVICYKEKLLTRLFRIWSHRNKIVRVGVSIVTIIAVLYSRTKIVPTVFAAPISGFIVMALFHFWEKPETIKKFFVFVGKHSTNIWLTHMFFYLYIFKGFVYVAKYPVLIFLLMLSVTIVVSMLLMEVERRINRLIIGAER